ncbi:MAG: magnesium chelatase, partial [Lentisphaeria bacterium]|nr:magnesium chelatase [Lentisphaeria bacterium]
AALDGRDFVTPDDVKFLAAGILGHRLILRPEHEIEGVTVAEVITHILEEVAVPR